MNERGNSYDYAVHSDFLIHWTGKDIDEKHHPKWWNTNHDHSSKTDSPAAEKYLGRLKDILAFGLWMTQEPEQEFRVGSARIKIPPAPECCFTELKLSESRRHARHYGRLGIGVKRPFAFSRFGRPLAYFGFGANIHNDKFLEACQTHLPDKSSGLPLTYDLYSESEWRIIFFKELLDKKLIVDRRHPANKREHAYFSALSSEQQQKLKYLVPLDGWFSMIIYPSLSVKNSAEWDENHGIAEEIKRLKKKRDHANRVEKGNWPIEVELDACRHF